MVNYELCVDNAKRFNLHGPSSGMSAVAVFEDSSCSETPVGIKITRDFVCGAGRVPAKTMCGSDGGVLYSISSCTNDYSLLASTVFGNNTPYIIVEEYLEWYCNLAQTVTIYIADGACHPNTDDNTSFKATLATEGGAMITTYNGTYCENVQDNIDVSKNMLASYTCVSGRYCSSDIGYGCGKRFSVGGFGGPPAMGRITSYAVYDTDSCSQPAQTVTMTRELSCTPQVSHWDPVCEDSGAVHYVKDCTRYYKGGWDDYGLINDAFGSNTSYLIVEEYDSWCNSERLINATAYVLDEGCHSNVAATMSTKFSFGLSLILTTYEGPDCDAAVNTTEITHMMLNHDMCVDNVRRFNLRGPSVGMTAVAVFEDSSCSETPVGVKITRDFMCGASQVSAKTVCGSDGGALYSISSCTNDYSLLASTVFGNNTPYIIVEEYLEMDCSQAQTVTVYIADGACHSNTDDATSFKATFTTEGTATITTYNDTYCGFVQDNIDVSKNIFTSYACVAGDYCISDIGYGCGKRFSVGGFGGPPAMGRMTSYAVYDTDSCSQPARTVTMTRELSCTPQVNHWDPVCEDSGMVHYVKDCTHYYKGGWDAYGLFDRAFGSNESYLLVEEYEMYSWCNSDSVSNTTAYVLDEGCHSNVAGTSSNKFSFGHSHILTTYKDPDCVTAVNVTEITHMMLNHDMCVESARRFYLRGPSSGMTAVAVFENSSCSEMPVGIKITRDVVCGASQVSAKTVCGSDGGALYSISSCTNDYSLLASTVFGNNTPYIIMEEYLEWYCNLAQTVTIYIADGACHSNTDNATSFKATFTTEGIATITTYNDTYCGFVQDNIDVSKNMLTSYTCVRDEYCSSDYGCGKRFSVGGLGGARGPSLMKAAVLYDTKDCGSVPVELTAHPVRRSCLSSTTSTCQKVDWSYTLYQASDCVDDVAEFAASKFGSAPYLIVENYAADTNCQTQKSTVVYKADGKCHPRASDGTYFKITPSFGTSLTIATYPTSSCSDFDVEYVTVGTKFVNTGRCFDGNQRFYANMSALFAPSPPPMVDVESLTREQIMFPEWLWEPTPRRVFQSD
ncbi:hypothetical protein PF004_g13256 [Phytophthora fragariae]|uniref:Uncharacterized protein n=1 Tax=Phytophthora fragariae TaxID=53985 RepID=A0A6G0NSN9_9STRA|nr:hypothetical protein PF004_g13256 [Phytophthora fragariae]